MNHRDSTDDTSLPAQYEEGPVSHQSVVKLALLDVFANFCVTVGFSIVGSGVKCYLSSYNHGKKAN